MSAVGAEQQAGRVGPPAWWSLRAGLAPVLVLATAVMVVNLTDLDQRLADLLFHLEGGAWSLRRAPLLESVLHRGGRALVVVLAVCLLSGLLLSLLSGRMRSARRPLSYLLLSMGSATALVSLIKSLSPQHCPWSLQRYGGTFPVESWWEAAGSAGGHCFPAGHASAGYCLFGLYFVACRYAPRHRWRALAVPILLGFIFGTSQQLRGAHFLSHDLWSAMLCWVVAWAWARWLLVDRGSRFQA